MKGRSGPWAGQRLDAAGGGFRIVTGHQCNAAVGLHSTRSAHSAIAEADLHSLADDCILTVVAQSEASCHWQTVPGGANTSRVMLLDEE